MALIAGPIQTSGYQAPDYSQAIEASRRGGMLQQQITQGAVGQVTDYFKQQGEKKKLIKQSDVQIDAALKLFPDLAPTLQGVRDQIRDENVPLNDRAAIAESVAGLINMGTNQMRFQSEQALQQQRLGMDEMQYQASMESARARQIAEASKPPTTLDVPVAGGVQKTQWDPSTQSFVPIRTTGVGLTDLVKEFEGFNPKAYPDYGQTSIGYGTKGKPGEVLTEEEASRRLEAELADSAKRIEEAAALKGITLNENQFNALTSFDYNTGKGRNLISRFGDDPEALAAKMLEYTKAGGKTLPGLVKRRQVEAALLLAPTEQPVAELPSEAPIGFAPKEAKAFRPATPEESSPYGGVPGQIDTSTGQFYPITTSRESVTFRDATPAEEEKYGTKGQFDSRGKFYPLSTGKTGVTFRDANSEEVKRYGQEGQIDSRGKFYPLKQEGPSAIEERTQAFAEARRLYRSGKEAEALDLLNGVRAGGLFGSSVTAADLPGLFNEDTEAQPAPTQKQDSRPPLGELLSPR